MSDGAGEEVKIEKYNHCKKVNWNPVSNLHIHNQSLTNQVLTDWRDHIQLKFYC